MRQAFGIIVLTIFSASFAAQSQVFTVNEVQAPTYLFVLGATSGKIEGDTLILDGVPNVVYFSDRPNRIAGHRTVESFTSLWDNASDSFRADPPNATLSVLGGSGVKNTVVELISAEVKGNTISFKIRILDGDLTGSFGTSSLFVDNVCGGCIAGL